MSNDNITQDIVNTGYTWIIDYNEIQVKKIIEENFPNMMKEWLAVVHIDFF